MVKEPMDELKRYIPIADAIAQTFGENCEVVLHDLTFPQSSIFYIVNNHVTGRKIGQSFDSIITQVLLSKKFNNDIAANYKKVTDDNKVLKSTTVIIRNSEGEAIGALCINYDLAEMNVVKEYTNKFTDLEEKPTEKEVEVFGNIMEIVEDLIDCIIDESKVEKMGRNRKLEIVKFMDEKGMFLIKGVMDEVAEKLKISKVTLYSYLDIVRSQK